jgi:sulfoxide reductase heme-binding subunit YedZ
LIARSGCVAGETIDCSHILFSAPEDIMRVTLPATRFALRSPWGVPWRDPAKRFSALKLVTLLLVMLPGVVLAVRLALHDLGGRPLTEATHQTGDWTIRLLVLSLAVTPARGLLAWSRVVLLRRMLGLAAFCYVFAHFMLYCVDQKWRLLTIASEIAQRFYLTIGFVALLGLVALSVTSTDGWQRQMRGNWKKLHRLVFPIMGLALFHYFLQSKADVGNAVFWTGLFCWLAFWRLVPKRYQGRFAVLPFLTVAAGLATVAIEAGWYGAATKISAARVFAANLDLDINLDPTAIRPGWQVVAVGVLAIVVVAARRAWQRRGALRPAT